MILYANLYVHIMWMWVLHFSVVEDPTDDENLILKLLAVHDPFAPTNDSVGFNRDFDYMIEPVFKGNTCE